MTASIVFYFLLYTHTRTKARVFRFTILRNGVHGLRLDTAFSMPHESRIGKELITGVNGLGH
jgi:hypothetical protein